MPLIVINNTPIEFPEVAESPDWSPAVVEFAQQVEAALNVAIGQFDVAPQVMVFDAYNAGQTIPVNNLLFPTANVRATYITYAIYRSTSLSTVSEAGFIVAVYDASQPSNNKWQFTQGPVTGDTSVDFSVTDLGQFQITCNNIAGTSHSGRISYSAKAVLQT
jgi:hypothetical protein